MNQTPPTMESTKQDKTQSLANHLLWSLFLRQLFYVTVLNIVLFSTLFVSVVVWAEFHITSTVTLIQKVGFPTGETELWLAASELTVLPLEQPPEGISLKGIAPISSVTAKGLRNLIFGSTYRVEFEGYAVEMNLSGYYTLMEFIAHMIFTVEFFFLFQNLYGNNRTIRNTLRPFQELAVTAVRLNSVENLSPQEMDTLTDELDKINATHLDSRISLSGTQKELKTLALAINSMLDRVTDAYSAQMRFVSDASHELRTPIAVIQGYSAMLDRWGKTNPEALQESIDAIREEAKNMERLMEQLLFLARGDNKSQPVHKEVVNLSSLSMDVVREANMLFPRHTIISHWNREHMIVADPNLLKQLLRILVDNSLKYTPETGRVWLKLTPEPDNCIRITVQDEGMGIPPEDLPHIFKRFYRTDSSRTRETGGTGLGLSIAIWIAAQHQSWFEVTSREEIGTILSFTLPLADDELFSSD